MNLQEKIQKINQIIFLNEQKNWTKSKKNLTKTYKFKDFENAIDFVNKVAKIAENQNHHPEITIKYDEVLLSVTDHDKGNVSEKCYKLVLAIDKL